MVPYESNNVYVLMACIEWGTTVETLFTKSYALDKFVYRDDQTPLE